MKRLLLLTVLFIATGLNGFCQRKAVETGDVRWNRSLEDARKLSLQEHKPILILFQEIPGCSTCRNYGQNVLTHPLIVEAIESLFIPLCIHNNKGGADKRALKQFGEPSWNNPVVRIVDARLEDVVPRIAGQYSKAALVRGMVWSLQKQKREVPEYLSLLHRELQAQKSGLETTYFAMYCFWAGEKELGKLRGVYSTTAGYMDGKEVVKVVYNPLEISYFSLLQAANDVHCGDEAYTDNFSEKKIAKGTLGPAKVHSKKSFKPDKTPKYYLSKTDYKYIRMTPLQACRANSLLAEGVSCDKVFSPHQLEQYRLIHSGRLPKRKSYIGMYL